MISFTRDETRVRAEINTGTSVAASQLWLYWECGKELFADLLTAQLQKKLYEAIKAARRDAYNEGWRDKASRKTAKETWFSGTL
jgi:hypothetical protein